MKCKANYKNKRRLGFTLAETLITLAIIGIIAALIIPNLMRNYRASVLRSQFLAANAIVKNAESAMVSDGVTIQTLDNSEVKNYFKSVNVQLKNSGNPYKSFNGLRNAGAANAHSLSSPFVLTNGMTVWISTTSAGYSGVGRYKMLVVDINGVEKLPNRYGQDVFFWYQDFDTGVFTILASPSLYGKISGYSKYCSKSNGEAENGCGCGHLALTDPNWFKNLP